jgi:hypothetical protein
LYNHQFSDHRHSLFPISFSLVSFLSSMRFLAALSAVALVSAKRPSTIPEHDGYIRQRPDHDYPQPEIEVVEANKAYTVKLDCVGCPFAVRKEFPTAEWQQPPQANALVCGPSKLKIRICLFK